jgi:GNAT superfamily N-acetyltransferase
MTTPTPQYELRDEGPGDEAFLFALYASTRADELALWGWDDAQRRAFLEMQFRAHRLHYADIGPALRSRIVLHQGQPIGRIATVASAEAINLADIALLPEYRGRGIGGALIRAELAAASAAGLPLTLHVLRQNPAARLYARLGFVVVEDDGLYLQMFAAPLSRP